MRARDPAGRVLAHPSQTPGLVEQYGLTRAQTDRGLWAVEPGGRAFSGAAAANRVLAELGGAWAWLAPAYRWAPLGWAEDRVYGWVAAHRSRLRFWSTTLECERPDTTCA